MKTRLTVNDSIIPLNDFTQRYIGNVLRAIAQSLDVESKEVTVLIEPGGLKIYSNSGEIGVRKYFVKQIVESTIKGMLSSLKGISWLGRIIITTAK